MLCTQIRKKKSKIKYKYKRIGEDFIAERKTKININKNL